MRRTRPRQEPLGGPRQCICTRSAITELPWATRKTRGQVARPSHNAAAHLTACPHSELARTATRDSVLVALVQLRGRAEKRAKKRRRIARVVIVAA